MRASKSEDALEQVKLQLMEREVITSEQQSELDMMHSQMSKLSKERSQAVAELSACKMWVNCNEGKYFLLQVL